MWRELINVIAFRLLSTAAVFSWEGRGGRGNPSRVMNELTGEIQEMKSPRESAITCGSSEPRAAAKPLKSSESLSSRQMKPV